MKHSVERILIHPKTGDNLTDQFDNCLEQIRISSPEGKSHILHQSFFINAVDNVAYSHYVKTIYRKLESMHTNIPSTSVIAQPPASGLYVTVEITILTGTGKCSNVVYCCEQGINYTVVETGPVKELYAGGISDMENGKLFFEKVNKTYNLLQSILDKESFSLSDIVRQWNYVEQILSIQEDNGEYIQNYQILNDIRSAFYAEVEFSKGYPAATGIGMNAGGLVIEIYAVKSGEKVRIVPLKNPKQVDAYKYSEAVLVGDAIKKLPHKTTPKFERAKYISVNGADTIFISGTASIQNEKTIGGTDTKQQTKITIENIESILSEQNLKTSGVQSLAGNFRYSFIRVYIKNAGDIEVVSEICEKYFKNAPIHYLIADVCREQLLLEIEAVVEAI